MYVQGVRFFHKLPLGSQVGSVYTPRKTDFVLLVAGGNVENAKTEVGLLLNHPLSVESLLLGLHRSLTWTPEKNAKTLIHYLNISMLLLVMVCLEAIPPWYVVVQGKIMAIPTFVST